MAGPRWSARRTAPAGQRELAERELVGPLRVRVPGVDVALACRSRSPYCACRRTCGRVPSSGRCTPTVAVRRQAQRLPPSTRKSASVLVVIRRRGRARTTGTVPIGPCGAPGLVQLELDGRAAAGPRRAVIRPECARTSAGPGDPPPADRPPCRQAPWLSAGTQSRTGRSASAVTVTTSRRAWTVLEVLAHLVEPFRPARCSSSSAPSSMSARPRPRRRRARNGLPAHRRRPPSHPPWETVPSRALDQGADASDFPSPSPSVGFYRCQ